MKTFIEQIRAEVRAHTGITVVQTEDEQRVIQKCGLVAEEFNRDLWRWTLAMGLQCLTDSRRSQPAVKEPAQLLMAIFGWQEGPAVVIAHDLVSWINHPEQNGPVTARALQDFAEQQRRLNDAGVRGLFPQDGSGLPEDPANQMVQLVLVDSEAPQRPCGGGTAELERPDRQETEELLDRFLEPQQRQQQLRGELDREAVVSALAGLTGVQQQRAIELAFAAADAIDPQLIQQYKRRILQAVAWSLSRRGCVLVL